MQSTGQASTHAVSFVFTHGSQMMYAIETPSRFGPVEETKQGLYLPP